MLFLCFLPIQQGGGEEWSVRAFVATVFWECFKELFWKVMVSSFLLFALHGQNIVLLCEVIDVVCGGIMKTLLCYDDCRKKNPNCMVTYL